MQLSDQDPRWPLYAPLGRLVVYLNQRLMFVRCRDKEVKLGVNWASNRIDSSCPDVGLLRTILPKSIVFNVGLSGDTVGYSNYEIAKNDLSH